MNAPLLAKFLIWAIRLLVLVFLAGAAYFQTRLHHDPVLYGLMLLIIWTEARVEVAWHQSWGKT